MPRAFASGEDRDDIDRDEITYWHNVRFDEAQEMVRLRRAESKARRAYEHAIENQVRAEFGHREVGHGWVSESQLMQIVARLFPDTTIEQHARPDWLDGLEFDIWLPDLRLAVEYQGQQHFQPIKAWGGQAALAALRERDARKLRIAEKQGIRLVCIDYTEPLTREHVCARLS